MSSAHFSWYLPSLISDNYLQLSNVLEIDTQLVQNAISVYCRLGFARKKYWDMPPDGLHSSWSDANLEKKKYETLVLLVCIDVLYP